MNREYSQLSLLDEIEYQEEQRARIRERALRTKLEDEYVQIREIYSGWENIPDHTVLICESDRLAGNRIQHQYFRCVVGLHRTVSGRSVHITSAPSAEWPDAPSWCFDDRHGCKWTYPGHGTTLWVKKTPETDMDAGWTEP